MNEKRLKADLDFERTKRKTLSCELQQLKAENEKYKQCLDEIEKYCNNAMDFSIYGDALGIVAKNILQKIKEVKGE